MCGVCEIVVSTENRSVFQEPIGRFTRSVDRIVNAQLQFLFTVKFFYQLQRFTRVQLLYLLGNFGAELYDLCRGIDERPVEPHRERKSLSNEETFATDLETLAACEEKLEETFRGADGGSGAEGDHPDVTKIFVKLKFADFTRTTVERAGLAPSLGDYRSLLAEAFARSARMCVCWESESASRRLSCPKQHSCRCSRPSECVAW